MAERADAILALGHESQPLAGRKRSLATVTNVGGNVLQSLGALHFGDDPLAIILMDSLAYMYQLFVHTQTIHSLRFFEWFLNTPSHHRVHHGSNPEYIDN